MKVLANSDLKPGRHQGMCRDLGNTEDVHMELMVMQRQLALAQQQSSAEQQAQQTQHAQVQLLLQPPLHN